MVELGYLSNDLCIESGIRHLAGGHHGVGPDDATCGFVEAAGCRGRSKVGLRVRGVAIWGVTVTQSKGSSAGSGASSRRVLDGPVAGARRSGYKPGADAAAGCSAGGCRSGDVECGVPPDGECGRRVAGNLPGFGRGGRPFEKHRWGVSARSEAGCCRRTLVRRPVGTLDLGAREAAIGECCFWEESIACAGGDEFGWAARFGRCAAAGKAVLWWARDYEVS